jgi:hypothetical protein
VGEASAVGGASVGLAVGSGVALGAAVAVGATVAVRAGTLGGGALGETGANKPHPSEASRRTGNRRRIEGDSSTGRGVTG